VNEPLAVVVDEVLVAVVDNIVPVKVAADVVEILVVVGTVVVVGDIVVVVVVVVVVSVIVPFV